LFNYSVLAIHKALLGAGLRPRRDLTGGLHSDNGDLRSFWGRGQETPSERAREVYPITKLSINLVFPTNTAIESRDLPVTVASSSSVSCLQIQPEVSGFSRSRGGCAASNLPAR
jgi:hypothetical protein